MVWLFLRPNSGEKYNDVCWESEDDNLSDSRRSEFHIVENFNKQHQLIGWTALSVTTMWVRALISGFYFDNPEFPKGKNFQDSLLLAVTWSPARQASVNLSKL